MNLEQIIPHVRAYNQANFIDDNVLVASEQIAKIASKYFKNGRYNTEAECLNAAYYLYLRSFDSLRAAIIFNQELGYAK
jgi:hypothetical protein